MDEQVIDDLYNRAISKGYKKSRQEFVRLLHSDGDVINDMYSYVQSKGYKKGVDDFKELIGATIESATSLEPKKKEDTTGLPSGVGSSASSVSAPDDKIKALFKKYAEESSLRETFADRIIPTTPATNPEFKKALKEVSIRIEKEDAELAQAKLSAENEFDKLGEKPRIEQSKYLNEQLTQINKDLIGKGEEYVVPEMQYRFGNLGFKFEEAEGGRDYMNVTASNGKTTQVSLDNFLESTSASEAFRLQKFIQDNTPVKGLFAFEKTLRDQDKVFNNQKEIDESLASINSEQANIMARKYEFVKIQSSLEAEKANLESVPEKQRNTPEYIAKVNDFISRADKFSSDLQTFEKDIESLKNKEQQLNTSIGKYTEMKAQQGTWYGAGLNAFANKSYYDMAKGLTGVTIDFIGEVISATGLPIMSQENYEKNFIEQAKKEGINITEGEDFISITSRLSPETLANIENRVKDVGKKSVKGEVIGDLDKTSKMIMESSGVSPEYYQSVEETFVGGALLGALTSIPAMAGGPLTRTVLMGSQVLSGLDAEMANDPAFADISENEKYLVKGPIAVAVATLESIGLSNLINQKGFLNGLVLKALGKVGKGASYKTFGEAIKNEIDSAVARGALTLGAGFLAEAETGALQEVADISIKEIYNMAKEKEMFDTPDSVVQFIERVGKASIQEGIGAGVISIPASVSAAYSGKGFLEMDDNQFMLFEKIANDSNIKKGFIATLKSRINSGEITAAEGKDILNNYTNSVGILNSLPNNLDIQGKKQAMNLLKERRELELQISGKDQALTAPQRNRITQINEQLTKLSEDAVQKQAAGQVPVQPEARVGQEVAQGEPQAEPQVVTQEGQKEIADENVILSGLRDGFKAVTRNSFDIRSDADVMQNIENRKSFTTSVTKNGKKYLVVGLKLKDVEATTSGRDGYSFAAIEDDGNLPSNAVDVLTQKAVSNVSSVYPNIKEPTIDMFAPVEGVRKVQPQVQEEVAPTQEVDFTEEEVSELEKAISKNLPEYFQLATKKESPEKMAVLTDAATKLMDQVQPEIVKESEVVEQPSIDTIPITVTENVELANKVPKMSVNDLVGKKVNYVMADQLKVDDELMGGPFFPLMDDTFGKVAWASMDEDAAKNIIRGFIKGDYSVVYNMSPSAIDSNIATLNEFVKRLNSIPASENIYPQISEYLKGRKFGKDTKAIQDLVDKSSNLESFIDGFTSLNVDQKQAIIKAVLPSKSVNATTKLGSTLQNNNITQESVREAISEQFARDLPMGAMTMVLEITDAEGNPIKSEADIDKAIMTRDQQIAEGIRPHKNYPVYIRGRAVAMLSDTVPVWNVSSRALDTMNKKAAGILQKKVPQPEGTVEGTQETRRFSAAEIRADEMYTLQRSSTRAEEVLVPMNTQYQIFVEKLSKAIPSVEIVTSQVEFDNLMNDLNAKKLATKNQKIYGAVLNGKLYLNPGLENFNTPIHEFSHVWMNTVKELSPEIYNKGIDLIKNSEYVSQVEENTEYKRVTNRMKEDGMTDEQIRQYVLEEALATAIGDKGESFVNASQKRNFKNWLNELFQFIKKLTGISKLTPDQIQDLSLDDFLNSVVVDLLSEKPIFKNAEVKNLSNQLQLMARPDLKADDIVKIGLANGFSEGSIRELLKRRGFTQEEINRSVSSTVKAAKKVEVTEEFAPGYDRVLNEIFGKDGIVDRSRRRGRSEEDTLKNAIDYLQQDTKVYENATDVQREAMVRNLRKEFKKREKAAPSAKRVLGQKKDVVTVTVDLAKERDRIIKEQIKLAKEITGDLNKKRAALAENIKPLIKRGIITAAQARTIINRISKVNLNNPIMVDRLVEYIDKVFDNANYAVEMDEIRKLQAQAKSRNHTSMTSLVNEFASINPEDIPLVDKETGEPLNKIMEYKEALDFLNTRTPFYGKMNEVFDEMVKYKKAEKFDAVKTKDALIDKYNSIMDKYVGKDKNGKDKLNTVEDYVDLIKDLNAFKRKSFQLLQNEAIKQDEYEDLINGAGKTQAVIDRKFAEPIAKIKKGLIADIKNQRPKPNPNFTKEQNDLIREYLQLSDADIENLSPEDLFILNDLLDNISNGEIDYYRLSDIVSRMAGKQEGIAVGKQLKRSKVSLGSAKLREEMAKFESSFWEGLLGLGRATSGPLQKFIISPFNRAIGSYEKFNRDGFNDFLKLKKKYKIDRFDPLKKSKEMHKIGMLTTYLQEHMAQFDPKNKDIKDIGKRDWFKQILDSETMRDDYSPKELKIIEEIYKTLPKDKDGNVNPKAVYDSYEANDGKFFTKNQKAFFDSIMEWKKQNSTGKQKAANEMSGNAFKEIPFHMLRSRYGSMSSQITPTTSGDNGMVRINAGTGKERVSEAVGAINTNFEKLFIKGLEQTGRDFFLTKALKDINNVLASAKKELDGDKDPLLKAISYTLSDALSYEFSDTASQNILKRLVQARAAMTLLDPIRTGIEFTSTLLSFGLRARTLSGYKNLFGSQGDMKNLLEFTDSPLRLRQNINNAIDINDGKIEKQSMLTKWTTFLSGLPERTMMVTSWMPTFTSEFQRITGEKFDMKKFNDSEAYREKYGKAIKESSAVADAQTEKIIGPTTKAGQRREIIIFPGKTVGRDTVYGQTLGFFSNYPFRESTEFINGFREAGEVLKKGDSIESILQLQKPLGIALNVAAYGFLSSVVYASRLILLGDDDEEERGSKMLEELMTAKGFIEETAANAAAMAASKYAGGGRAILQVLGTLGIALTDDEETKATIKKMLKGSVYVDPLPTQKLSGYGTADKVNTAIIKYIPEFVVLSNTIIDTIGGVNEVKSIYDKVESKGIDALTIDEELKVLALSVMFTATQLFLNYRGTSLPSYNNLKAGMKTIKEEAGVADIADGKVPSKKKSSRGGSGAPKTINKTDMKKYFPDMYNELYGPGSPTYEVEQEVKAFEKEQRKMEEQIKKEIYGGR